MNKLLNISKLLIITLILSVAIIAYFQSIQHSTTPLVNVASATAPSHPTSTPIITQAIATPTVSPTATSSPILNLTATPTIYVSIGEIRPITLSTPIVLPTATPTPTFEPLHGQAIGGYVFSTARPVPNVPSDYYDLIEWLPDDPNKLLVVRYYKYVEVIDVVTGVTKRYSGDIDWVKNPIWVPSQQAVAYMVDFESVELDYLYIVNTNSNLNTLKPSFTTTTRSPLVTTPSGDGVILFDKNWQLTQVSSNSSQDFQLPTNITNYKPLTHGHGDLYQVSQSPDRTQALYYNDKHLLLVNFITNNLTDIDVESLKRDDMPPLKPIKDVVWSPDGTKLALQSIISRYSAYWVILDLPTNTLTYLGDNTRTYSHITWAPDNKHILAYTSFDDHINEYGIESGYGLAALFLFDIETQQRYAVAALPEIAVINSSAPILWSQDGKHIAVVFGDEPENPVLYVIDVTKP